MPAGRRPEHAPSRAAGMGLFLPDCASSSGAQPTPLVSFSLPQED